MLSGLKLCLKSVLRLIRANIAILAGVVKFFTPPQPGPYEGPGVRNSQMI